MSTTVASSSLTAQNAAIATTTLYTIPTGQAGQYKLSFNAKVTRKATTSSQIGNFTATYTDPDGNTVTLVDVLVQSASGSWHLSVGENSVTTGAAFSGPVLLNCAQNTNVTFAVGYASVGATSMQYNFNIVLEQL